MCDVPFCAVQKKYFDDLCDQSFVFAAAVTENEFKLFQRAMSEQGLSKSTTADVIAAASKKGHLDAWGASGGMPRV
jgi:triphosphoribosyl-dephospho-CoA synthetase